MATHTQDPAPTYPVRLSEADWEALGVRLAEMCRQDPHDEQGRAIHDRLREQLAPHDLTAWRLP